MQHVRTLLSATAVVAALILGTVPAAAQTGRVGGTVKDGNGQPIKGATVVAENPSSSPSSFTATTDDKGRYSIIGLRSGNWKITASAPGFTPVAATSPSARSASRTRRWTSCSRRAPVRPGRSPA
jgi:hypothetical protein